MVRKLSLQDAKDQATEYFGTHASLILELDDQEFEIPHPDLLSEDQIRAFDKLAQRVNECDRDEPASVKVEMNDGSVMESTPGKGELIRPYQKAGVLLDPPYPVQVCQALWGEDTAKAFIAAGGPPGLIELTWQQMNDEAKKRKKSDPKS